ncbi:MAG: VIT1/CCC1 transporter family protein [Rhodobacterales bacterium]
MGAIPLTPYFIFDRTPTTLVLSVRMIFLVLVALGLLRWVATRDRLRRALAETVAVGAVCALVAYIVGWLVGG